MSMYARLNKPDRYERIKVFYEWLCAEEYRMTDLVTTIIKKEWKSKDITFSIGMESKDVLSVVSQNNWVEEPIEATNRIKSIKRAFEKHTMQDTDNVFVQYCQCVGKWKNTLGMEYRIYYFFSIQNCEGISSMYLQTINEVYYTWLTKKIDYITSSVTVSEKSLKERNFKEKMCREIADEFHRYMLKMFNIDLNVITDLSGSRYEGQSCRAELVFQLSGKLKGEEGVAFKEKIEVCTKYIRSIRKFLQMGQRGQYMLAEWEPEEQKWKIAGLYEENNANNYGVTFRILNHMVWEMEIEGHKALCYACGKYFIDCDKFKINKFNGVYKKVFGNEAPEKVKSIYENAMRQSHGTVVIVWEEAKAEEEIKRLQNESTITELEDKELSDKYVEGVTAIDGALCIDSAGKCYGIGVILDGNVKMKGNPERGARFNSSRRYVKQCQEKNIRCIAAVISEDKTIDLFDTLSIELEVKKGNEK